MIEEAVGVGLSGRALAHKRAIQAEMQRREDLKNEKKREQEEAAKAKERRRERRMCLKEQKRIQELVEVLMVQTIPGCEQKEYSHAMPVYDIRDYKEEKAAGIYTFGGFVGELIMALNSMQENLMQKGDAVGFEVTNDVVIIAANKLIDGKNIDGYGLKFFLDQCRKINVAENVIQAIIEAICKINYHQPTELIPMPDDDENEDARDKTNEQNDEIEKQNELYNKLKQYVRLVVPEPTEDD